MTRFVWKKSKEDYTYLRLDPKYGIQWTREINDAFTYMSRYAAKRHIKRLDNIPETVELYECR